MDVAALLRLDEGLDALDARAAKAMTVLEGGLEGSGIGAAGATIGPTAARPEPRRQGPAAAGDETTRVIQAAATLGVDAARFEGHAEKRWGKGWKMNANGRKRALDEVAGFGADGEGFRAKVDAERDIFS